MGRGVSNILVIHQGALGDLVLSFPALSALAGKTGSFLDLVCLPQWEKAALAVKAARRTISSEQPLITGLFADPPDLKSLYFLRSYQRVILFSFSESLEKACATSGVPITRIAPRPGPGVTIHAARHIWEGLTGAGLLPEPPVDFPDSWIPAGKAGRESAATGGPVLLHPGAGSPRKRWPLERFAELAGGLRKMGIGSRYLIGPAEEGLLRELAGLGAEPADIVQSKDMATLLHHLKNCRALVGNDSGVSHLSAFMGIPTLAVFGPSDPLRWRPVGRSVKVLRPGNLTCGPCFESCEKNCDAPKCLADTGVEDVLGVLAGMLAGVI
ncbi:MAG: glycosyltransferase family 9 protein [Deltaproteobacteria bacterium]|nr:glycosyltransferase family 9 protein [Deltaproteobacteria bacterium]